MTGTNVSTLLSTHKIPLLIQVTSLKNSCFSFNYIQHFIDFSVKPYSDICTQCLNTVFLSVNSNLTPLN